jgi:hypothetical protein
MADALRDLDLAARALIQRGSAPQRVTDPNVLSRVATILANCPRGKEETHAASAA